MQSVCEFEGNLPVRGKLVRSIATVFSILLAITLTACASRKTHYSDAEVVRAFERTIGAQDRVNRYFHKQVLPRLLPCWTRLEGKGTIAVQIEYRREGESWAAGNSSIGSSTLAKGQDETALGCFQEAVRATSFPVEKDDGEAKEFLVNWSFPVPWPRDVAEVARMISTNPGGGGGCGGPEAPAPACWDCGFIPIISLSYCKRTCAGYSNCTLIPNGCQMGPITPKCVTVSPWGNQGGIVVY
jgi:hypothetical protein